MRKPRHSVLGISLIEAVVALAVMAFGMLAYVGLQSTLRFNGDVAKQRSEAVRIAQEAIEDWRAYSVIETTPDFKAYEDLPAGALDPVTVDGDNTRYTLARTVVDASDTEEALLRGAAPRMKTVVADVSWQDRNGDAQSVRLSTTIAASPPELAGTLAVKSLVGPSRQPLGRSPSIPVVARDLGDGLSGFKPPGAGGDTTVWVFNNTTGVIVGVCNGVTTDQAALTAADVQSCSNNANGLPLSGFVRFSTDLIQPEEAEAENPVSTALNLDMALTLVSTGHPTPSHVCYAAAPMSESLALQRIEVPYYCIVFTNSSGRWSGRSNLVPLAFSENPGSPWQLAENAGDSRADRYRVCRYTPATSDEQPVPNVAHPHIYIDVHMPLLNQNFLVIRAGDDRSAFLCPTDDPPDPAAGNFVNSNTLLHQPLPLTP